MSTSCPKCGSPDVSWSTIRRNVPIDLQQCRNCSHTLAEEDWVAPLPPARHGFCMNCGDVRKFDVCVSCGLSKPEDEEVHDELRQLVAPQHDFLNAAREANRMGRRVLALKLATASFHLEPQNRDAARARRIWLLSRVGETQWALDDAEAWVKEAGEEAPAIAWASLGEQQDRLESYGAAADAYYHAIVKDPNLLSIRARFAWLMFFKLNRHGQAQREATVVLNSRADEASIETALQVMEARAERLAGGGHPGGEMERLLESVGPWIERSGRLVAYRAHLKLRAGDIKGARTDLKRVKQLDPELELAESLERKIKEARKRDSWWRWS